MLEQFRDTWGWYRFYPHADYLIHPDDLDIFHVVRTTAARSNGAFCSVFACAGIEQNFLRVRWKDYTFRTKTDNYAIVPSPKLYWGEMVRIKRKPNRIRRVLHIWFHHKRKQIVYHIESSDPYGTSYWFYDELEVVTTK